MVIRARVIMAREARVLEVITMEAKAMEDTMVEVIRARAVMAREARAEAKALEDTTVEAIRAQVVMAKEATMEATAEAVIDEEHAP